MSAILRLRAWTADEYDRMVAAGVLTEDDRVELVEGEIVEMAPIGARHAASVNSLARILQSQLADRYVVSVQNPVRLGEHSEPQPDLAVLAWRDDLYRDALPGAPDVLLVIEVADSSAAVDREVKLPLYARAGIEEAWLVDIAGGAVEVYTRPSATGYGRRENHRISASVDSDAVAGLTVPVRDALVELG